jgi:hypothetical protein
MITIQKVTNNVQSVPRQSPDIYWHAELCSRRPCSVQHGPQLRYNNFKIVYKHESHATSFIKAQSFLSLYSTVYILYVGHSLHAVYTHTYSISYVHYKVCIFNELITRAEESYQVCMTNCERSTHLNNLNGLRPNLVRRDRKPQHCIHISSTVRCGSRFLCSIT